MIGTKEQVFEPLPREESLDSKPTMGVPRQFRISLHGQPVKTGSDELGLGTFLTHESFVERLEREQLALGANPTSPVALVRVGLIYMREGKYLKARVKFEQALRYDSIYIEAALNLARVYVFTKKLDRAEEQFNYVLKAISDKPEIRHELSFALLAAGKTGEARASLEAVSNVYERYYEVLNTIGISYFLEGNLSQASKLYKASNKLNPGYAPAMNNLGIILQQTGDLGAAVAKYREACNVDPSYIEAHMNLIQVLMHWNKFEEALELVEPMQRFKAIAPVVVFLFAWLKMRTRQYVEAIRLYTSFLGLPIDSIHASFALNNIGYCLTMIGNLDDAIEYYRHANEADSRNDKPVFNLLNTYTDTGRRREAVSLARHVISVDPKNDAAHYALGSDALFREQWELAKEHFIKALSAKTQISKVYGLLGFILVDVDRNPKEAINVLLKGRKVTETNVVVNNNLVHAYLQANDVAKAQELQSILGNTPVELATRALLKVKEGKLDEAKGLFTESRATAGLDTDFAHKVEQREHFDLANHYKNYNINKAISEYKNAITREGFGFINVQSREAIKLLSDKP